MINDATGKIIGSFFIPNTDTIRFETGVKEFKLLDITVNSGQEFVFGFGNSLSRASAKFTATGIIPKEQERTVVYKTIYQATTTVPRRGRDSRYYVDANGNIRKTFRVDAPKIKWTPDSTQEFQYHEYGLGGSDVLTHVKKGMLII